MRREDYQKQNTSQLSRFNYFDFQTIIIFRKAAPDETTVAVTAFVLFPEPSGTTPENIGLLRFGDHGRTLAFTS